MGKKIKPRLKKRLFSVVSRRAMKKPLSIEKAPDLNIHLIDLAFDLKPLLSSAVQDLGASYGVLVLSKSKNYSSIVRAFVDLLVNDNGLSGIYVSADKPYDKMLGFLKKEIRIDEKKLYFIDCISSKTEDAERAIAVPPNDLSNLNTALGDALSEHPRTGFVIIESLSTLFIYNEEKAIERFVLLLIEKMNQRKLRLVVIATKTRTNESALETISALFDKVVQIDGD